MSPQNPPPPLRRSLLLWALGALAIVWAYVALVHADSVAPADEVAYTQLLRDAEMGRVQSLHVQGAALEVRYKSGASAHTANPGDPYLVSDMRKAGVEVFASPLPQPVNGAALQVAGGIAVLLAILLGATGYAALRRQVLPHSRSHAPQSGSTRVIADAGGAASLAFKDVAGCDEAKGEVAELVEFLRDPARFQKLGAQIPRGVLLYGPPGTGKTLLAKAIAGEAGVPFFSMAGSGFVEMFVGVGAARVRDLFAQAQAQAPCIIFVDEIDAVGRTRGAGQGGSSDEREHTLNQLLVEMDGFEPSSGVIVMAATNRTDVLDPALTRPGRFDRQVHVMLPDVRGREQILRVHLRKVPATAGVDVLGLARATSGFSGADIANLVNEAALGAARRRGTHVEMRDFESAKDKALMGLERQSAVIPEHERRITAYHEAGHAVAARLLPGTDPLHKVSIVPRGRALGVTVQVPDGDRYSTTKEKLESTIAVLFGGRVAEEAFTGQTTTGASNDFERATDIARNMVTRWGYSEAMGPMVLGGFEPGAIGTHTVAAETLREADVEVRELLRRQYARTQQLLAANADKVHALAAALLEWETLDAGQVDDALAGRPVRQPPLEPRARRDPVPAGATTGVPAAV